MSSITFNICTDCPLNADKCLLGHHIELFGFVECSEDCELTEIKKKDYTYKPKTMVLTND